MRKLVANGTPLDTMDTSKYLSWIINTNDDDWLEIHGNLLDQDLQEIGQVGNDPLGVEVLLQSGGSASTVVWGRYLGGDGVDAGDTGTSVSEFG